MSAHCFDNWSTPSTRATTNDAITRGFGPRLTGEPCGDYGLECFCAEVIGALAYFHPWQSRWRLPSQRRGRPNRGSKSSVSSMAAWCSIDKPFCTNLGLKSLVETRRELAGLWLKVPSGLFLAQIEIVVPQPQCGISDVPSWAQRAR